MQMSGFMTSVSRELVAYNLRIFQQRFPSEGMQGFPGRMDVERQIHYYNDRWAGTPFANNLGLARCVEILRGLLSLELSAPRICDLGCGSGWLTTILGCFGPTVGIDFSDTAIAEASRRYLNAQFVCADIMNWSYPKGAFDVVVSQEVLEHVPDQVRYLSVAHGLLRSGGHLILTTPNARTMLATPEDVRHKWTDQPNEDWVTRPQLAGLMRSFFEDISITSMTLTLGSRGSYRIVNSYKVQNVLNRIGVLPLWTSMACRLAYGLHLLATGKKR
jgi:2-polyprenyl-3-methyl-5-hydroxy-6-metoxy-1,4-benzoquinol methylase